MAKSKKSNKIDLDFPGMNNLISEFEKMQASVEPVAERALKASHAIVTANAIKAMTPHNKTRRTIRSLRKFAKVEKFHSVYRIDVGFDINNGGLPSVFLMYGTKVHGTPRVKPDKNLYNAFYGKATTARIEKAQERIFYDELDKLWRKG